MQDVESLMKQLTQADKEQIKALIADRMAFTIIGLWYGVDKDTIKEVSKEMRAQSSG